MNRWLNINKVSALARAGTYVQIPTFNVAVTWLGYSDIVATFNVSSPNSFTFQLDDLPVNPNYVLCIAWADSSGNVRRYKLWDHDEAVIYDTAIPQYAGQVIRKNFRWEVWSVNNATASEIGTHQLTTSVRQAVDDIEADDVLLAGNGAENSSFNSAATTQTEIALIDNAINWFSSDYGVDESFGTLNSWTSRLSADTFVQGGVTKPSILSVPGIANDALLIRFPQSTKKLEYNQVDISEQMFAVIIPHSPGPSSGTFITYGSVQINLAAAGAYVAGKTRMTVNDALGGAFSGSYELVHGTVYVVEARINTVYLYELTPTGAIGPIYTFSGTASGEQYGTFSIGTAKEGWIIEFITYGTMINTVADYNVLFKYFSDKYGSGMMSLPLTFPTNSEVPSNT